MSTMLTGVSTHWGLLGAWEASGAAVGLQASQGV